jgi:hypothetical protein
MALSFTEAGYCCLRPAGLLRNFEDPDPDTPDLHPDLAEPDYDDAAFAEALTDYDETGEDPR